MRTTLEIDPRVLAAARARVSHGTNRSIGEAVSEIALMGLQLDEAALPTTGGLVLLPVKPGHVVTSEMVTEALQDE